MCAEQATIQPALLIEYGSWQTKIGTSGNKTPLCVNSIYSSTDHSLFGEEVNKPEIIKTADFLFNNEARIKNYDLIENFTNYCLKLFKTDTKNRQIFNFREVNTTNEEISKLTELAFETYEASSYYIGKSNVLSLYAYGHLTGVCLNIGHNMSSSTVVSKGYAVPSAAKHCVIAGSSINAGICNRLAAYGCIMDHTLYQTQRLLDNLKKCNLSYSTEDSKLHIPQEIYNLPDGTTIMQDIMSQSATSITTEPINIIHDVIAIANLPKSDLYNNIILSGGTTAMPNCHSLIQSAIQNATPNTTTTTTPTTTTPTTTITPITTTTTTTTTTPTTTITPITTTTTGKITVLHCPTSHNSSYIGASILTSLSNMNPLWVSKLEYQEHGTSIAVKKCA